MGSRIKEARLARGWSQQDLADRVRVSQPTIVHWEQGTHAPRNSALARLSDALGVSRQWLVGDGSGRAPSLEPPREPVAEAQGRVMPFPRRRKRYWSVPTHHVPVYPWPRNLPEMEQDIEGVRDPIEFMPYSGNPIEPISFVCGDDALSRLCPSGSILIVDLGVRLVQENGVYLLTDAEGQPIIRRWRTGPGRMEADTMERTHFHASPPSVLGRVLWVAQRLDVST